jgi:hypothetical protein
MNTNQTEEADEDVGAPISNGDVGAPDPESHRIELAVADRQGAGLIPA